MQLKTEVLSFFNRFRPAVAPRDTAKDRMRSMLTYDRLELPAGRLECLEEELMAVVGRYFELDKNTTQFDLQQYDRRASLIANFPLLRSKC
ncbi:MAG: cell division topological specificity factor MinE [Candidatus Melainabacteria bacterium]|nr:cell division topological specificity factor MinE [Candidatus Melainabacteria bacterium]